MGGEMSQVLPGLYVGGLKCAKDKDALERSKVTHVVAVHNMCKRMFDDKEYLLIDVVDAADADLRQHFAEATRFVHTARCANGGALIHCMAGCSRSVTLAVAYIMAAYGFDFRDALNAVRARRAVANPNYGFLDQLRHFDDNDKHVLRAQLIDEFADRFTDSMRDRDMKFLHESLQIWDNHVRGGQIS